ncbi:hypothetical protein E2320_007429, partial [Naja naja]
MSFQKPPRYCKDLAWRDCRFSLELSRIISITNAYFLASLEKNTIRLNSVGLPSLILLLRNPKIRVQIPRFVVEFSARNKAYFFLLILTKKTCMLVNILRTIILEVYKKKSMKEL